MTSRRPHVAVWCPMPPVPSEVAEHGFRLVEALGELLSVSVVVSRPQLDRARVPAGAAVLAPDEALLGHLDQPDVHLYHLANDPALFGWVLGAVVTRPGVVVLHDSSLADLFRGVCAGSPLLWERVLANFGRDRPVAEGEEGEGAQRPEGTTDPFLCGVVERSLCAIVSSRSLAEQIARCVPGKPVVDLPWTAEHDQRGVRLGSAEGPDQGDDARSGTTWQRVAAAYVPVLDQQVRRRVRVEGPPPANGEEARPAEPAGIPGLNVHGDWKATTGLAHAARRLCVGLLSQGVPVAVETVASHAPTDPSLLPPELDHAAKGRRYPVDLWTLNLNEFHLVPDDQLRSPRTRRHHIVTWYWELPDVPASLVEQFERVDEIWVPSQFVRRAFVRQTRKPTTVVPTIVPTFVASDRRSVLRDKLGLPRDAVTFLFSFDFNSTVGRKNPLGVVEAFTHAFPERLEGSPTLVMKAIHLDRAPEFAALLADAVGQAGGILVDSLLSGQELADLFQACDVYVSLHRSEGFGLGMAEAMAIGKPVIATGYSGNLDFMNVANSCLVGYRLRPVTADDHRYNPEMSGTEAVGSLWAEPDLEHAARWMRLLAADEHLRRRIGERGRQTIQASFTEEAVGRIVLARLRALADELHLEEPCWPCSPAGVGTGGGSQDGT
ncbi:MAG: glycosyltransferase family 4 protein [Acidimicrobiales bacterium]